MVIPHKYNYPELLASSKLPSITSLCVLNVSNFILKYCSLMVGKVCWNHVTYSQICVSKCNQLAAISDLNLPRYVYPIINALHRPPSISYNFSTMNLALNRIIYSFFLTLLWSLSVVTRLIWEAIFILNELIPIRVALVLWRHVWIN